MVGGIFEELGWTGFAMPTLLRRMRYGVLTTGLIVGVLWGVATSSVLLGQAPISPERSCWPSVAANVLAWFPAL